MVGDGGKSWRARAQQRLAEKTSEEGTTRFATTPVRTSADLAVLKSDRRCSPPRCCVVQTVSSRPYEGRLERPSKGSEGWRRRDHEDRSDELRSDDRRGDAMDEDDGGHVFRARKREAPSGSAPREEEPSQLPSGEDDDQGFSSCDLMTDVLDDWQADQAQAVDAVPAAAPTPVPQSVPTEEEANKIQAQLLKAEMMGDEDRIKELKGKLAQIREAQKVVVISGLGKEPLPCIVRG